MISIFNIILSTLQRILFRPVLLLCGDATQQQPFEKDQNRLVPVTNALANRQFVSTTYHYNLMGQHRVGHVEYVNFLDHVRYWIPDQNTLDNLQQGQVLCPTGEIK